MTNVYPLADSHVGTTTALPSGFDGGNTDTCFSAIVDGTERTIVIPSAIAEGSLARLDLLRSGMQSDTAEMDAYKQDIQISYKGRSYLVGYQAIRQMRSASTHMGDESRYFSETQLVRLLASSGLAIPYAKYTIRLVTTLPVKYYSKELRKNVKVAFEGIHNFELNGVPREATISVKRVMVEGPSAMVLYGAPSAGKRRLIIDGGGYTTEFIMLDGNDPVAEHCDGIDLGVEDISKYVAEQMVERHQRRLSLRERTEVIRAYGSHRSQTPEPYPDIVCGSYRISDAELASMVKAGANKVGEETLSKAASLWGITNDLVAGDVWFQYQVGGSVLFYNDVLRRRMPNLTPVTSAWEANARGSARIAQALV